MKVIILLAALFCVSLIGLGYYFATREEGPKPRLILIDTSYTKRIEDQGWVRGNKDANVTVIEYADLQCPACRAFNPIMDEAYAKTKDIAQFSYRHYPLFQIHNKTSIATKAVEAAGRQGKFWEMQGLFFARQQDWEKQSQSDFSSTVVEYAKTLNLNIDQFKNDQKDSSIQVEIDKDIANGNKMFGNDGASTPTIVVNGTRLPSIPTSSDQFVQIIQQAANAPQS